jgi:hypothetical protein
MKGRAMSKRESETKQAKTADASGDRANLDRQYGCIGISAVAAALPYVSKTKNPAREEDERRSGSLKRSVLSAVIHSRHSPAPSHVLSPAGLTARHL